MVLLKIIDKNIEDYVIKIIYEKLDKNNDGLVSLDEFKTTFLEKDYSNDFEMHPILQ
jgi:hypothetical protein